MIQITAGTTSLNPYFVNLSITRELDGICSFSFDYPLSDSLSSSLTELSQVDISVNSAVVFSGRINNISDKVSNSTILRSVSGLGLLDDLRKKIIPPNILHYNELLTNSFSPSFANTVILDNTWTVTTESLGDVVTYLTSLQSSLSAISTFCQLAGYHYRYTSQKNLEIYKSLVSSGVTIQNTSNQGNFDIDNKTLIIDGEISTSTDTTELYNYVYAVGGTSDNGMNQITLRDVRSSTINPLYPISNSPIVPNTDASYTASVYTNIESAPNTTIAFVVSSPASITKYGQIDKAIAKKDVHVTSSDQNTFSNVNRQDAADQLYKSIVEEIKLHEEPATTISLNAYGDFVDLKVGQTVKLSSSKTIGTSGDQSGSGEVFNYSQDLILTKYTLKIGENNTFSYQLELSNIPKVQKGDIEVLTETIESVNDYERQRKGSVTTYPQYFKDSFDATYPLKGLFWIPEDFVYVDKLKLKIKVQAFRSYSTGATSASSSFASQAGGSSSPSSESGGGSSPSSQAGGSSNPSSTTQPSNVQGSTSETSHTHTIGNHTHTIGNHQHDITIPVRGPGTTGTPLFFSNASPELSTALGPGTIFNANGTSSGGGTTTSNGGATTSAGGTTHSHSTTIPAHSHTTLIGTHTHIVDIPTHTHITQIQSHTHQIDLNGQTLSIIYGIFEDTANPPTGLKLFIDGVDYSTQISIPNGFGETPSTNDSTIDLLVAIHNLGQFQAVFTPGIHEIELRCAGGRALGELHMYGQFYLESK